jgi:hypothetical protein
MAVTQARGNQKKILKTRCLRNTILEQKNRISKSKLEKASFARGSWGNPLWLP